MSEETPMIESIGFLAAVYVSDQDKALDFYVEKLGLTTVGDKAYESGVRWVEVALADWVEVALAGNKASIALLKPEDEDRIGEHTGITFRTDNIDATYKQLREQGVQFKREPKPTPWGGYDAEFLDQDDNKLLLIQYHKRPLGPDDEQS